MLIECVLAPNPGPMTLTGTNTYLIGDGSGAVAAVDPGPDDLPAHLEAVLERAAALGRLSTVIVTHRHLDHLPAAIPLCERTGATLLGHPDLPGVQRGLADGESTFAGLVAFHTPGHTRDSVCLWQPSERALLTGDLVLGTGTAVLDDAPGALTDYMASLHRLRQLEPRSIYPGHGPLVSDGVAKLSEYAEHRQQRVQQVIDALRSGAESVDEMTSSIYADVPRHLWPMAARNVRANLEMLLAQHRVEQMANDRWRLLS